MPRPRADGGQARGAVRIGKERTDESGKKWRARAYAPTSGAQSGRVVTPVVGELLVSQWGD